MRHRVVEGETLTGLAREYYGDPDRWPDIQRANGLTSDRIEAGQVLIIPR
jgi:nucleoid-associated protein YgaU